MSRARLGVRRRYRDDVRLDSRYAKTGWQWCHVLVSASVVATATTSASTRVSLRQGGSGVTCSSATTSASTRVTLRQGGCGVTCSSRHPSSLPRRCPPRLAFTLIQGGSGVTCSSQRPSSLPRRRLPRLALRYDRVAVVSRARLGVRRRYRDDVHLDSRYAKTGWQWCHVLVSASVVATATTSA